MTTERGDKQLAMLISGGGTTAEAVIKACQSGELVGIEPAVVIASKDSAGGLEKAQALGIQTEVIRRRDYGSGDAFGIAMLQILADYDVELVSQNGWLVHTPTNVIGQYTDKIVNQHPGPLDGKNPDFGGKGMYGSRVMCTLIAYSLLTGHELPAEATTHFVTEVYDEGAVIRAETLDVHSALSVFDGPMKLDELIAVSGQLIEVTETLQSTLLPIEHQTVIRTLQAFAEDNVPLYARSSQLIPDENVDILNDVKELAIELFPKG